ncbi:hypothetical protein SBRCBS47491_008226 [Sporothrix bragantina]|uniref:Uncharacterized protein n=1 Tax=Sporothrix bragantina TaxID=671064 RepID=A0ABP0CMJ8_9PEZI
MKASFLTSVLATAVSGVSAGVLVKRPAGPPPAQVSSSSSAAPVKHASPCKVGSNGLYACFRSSTDNALSYCSTAASVYLTATTTQVVEPGPTVYVTIASDTVTAVSTDLSVVHQVVTTSTQTVDGGVTTTYTTRDTPQTTTVYYQYGKRGGGAAVPAPMPTLFALKRDGSGVEPYVEGAKVDRREDDKDNESVPTTTIGVIQKRVTISYTITTCTTTTTVSVTTYKAKRTAPAVAIRIPLPVITTSSSSSSSSDPTNPPPACLSTLAAPQPSALTSACSAIVSQFGQTPTVTDVLVLPATTLTVASGLSTALSTLDSTSTSTTFTVLQVTTVSTVTIPMCTLVTQTVFLPGSKR